MMKLDYGRNYLLALELILSLVGASLGVGTLISGLFGMNLKSGVSSSSAGVFWWLVVGIISCCLALVGGGIIYFRRQGLLISV